MNYLVYMGLRNYEFPEARRILTEKSAALMMENVNLNGYIYENYNAITGNYKNLEEAHTVATNITIGELCWDLSG